MDRLDALLARFEAEHMDVHSITPARRRQQLKLLRTFAATLDHPLDQLTGSDVQVFMGAEIARGIKPNTVRKEHGMIRAFITWAESAALIDVARSAQLRSVRNPRGSSARSKPNPYKPSEVVALKDALAERFPALPLYGRGKYALVRWCRGDLAVMQGRSGYRLWLHASRVQLEAQIALALEGGLRRIEIQTLTIPAMHYDNDQVVVLTAKQGPQGGDVQVTRVVPYTAHARQCAMEWLDLRELLMPDHTSPWLKLKFGGTRADLLAPLPTWKMEDSLRKLGTGWRWHRLRHTAATEWLRAGVPLEKVRDILGHATLEQTREYTLISGSDLDSAMGTAEAAFSKRLGIAA